VAQTAHGTPRLANQNNFAYSMLDVIQAAILYVGLLVLFMWRTLFPWQPGKKWTKYLNHVTLLYALCLCLYIFELVMFILAAVRDFQVSAGPEQPDVSAGPEQPDEVKWPIVSLRVMVIASPAAVFVNILLCGLQSLPHLEEIRMSPSNRATWQHDRALNVIALPAVYSVMSMSALVRVYTLLADEVQGAGNDVGWQEHKTIALAKYENCMCVGDLYEAWALYQFGALTVELLKKTFTSKEEADRTTGLYEAVDRVMWLGLLLFLAVCLVQSGYSLWMWVFVGPQEDYERFESRLDQFSLAGMVAAGAAIYNVHTVEHRFGNLIEGYAPFLKFMSVKLLVFFAFWQKPVIWILRLIKVIRLSDVQAKLLQATLVTFECLLCAVLHTTAWKANEPWYSTSVDSDHDDANGEKRALLASAGDRATNQTNIDRGANNTLPYNPQFV